jgi:hypothetical protein
MMEKKFQKKLILGLYAATFFLPLHAQHLVTYPIPDGIPHNKDFSVKVRLPSHHWQDVSAYLVEVVEVKNYKQVREKTSMAYFDFSGKVQVSITYNRGNIDSARIRPLSYNIIPQIRGNTITFSLSQPRNLSIEVNGDIFHNLLLFANPLEEFHRNPKDTNVIYYGPGVYKVGVVRIPDGKTVYIAGGAVVKGQMLCDSTENIHIIGRGILGLNDKGGIHIEYSKNIEVNGIIALTHGNISIGQSQKIDIKNVKSISCNQWGDGMDVFTSSNVSIDSMFMRNSDDCIAIYGHRWNYYGNTKDVTVKNAILWADIAHPIFIGTHGDMDHPDTLENIQFKNIDILEQDEPQVDYQGCMAINAGDNNLVRNVLFEDVRVGDFREGQLVNLRVMFNHKYNTGPGRGIEKVYFKNITYNGNHANLSIIAGYDSARSIRDVVFDNLKINGELIYDDVPAKPGYYKTGDMARFYIGEHVTGLKFISTATGQ